MYSCFPTCTRKEAYLPGFCKSHKLRCSWVAAHFVRIIFFWHPSFWLTDSTHIICLTAVFLEPTRVFSVIHSMEYYQISPMSYIFILPSWFSRYSLELCSRKPRIFRYIWLPNLLVTFTLIIQNKIL